MESYSCTLSIENMLIEVIIFHIANSNPIGILKSLILVKYRPSKVLSHKKEYVKMSEETKFKCAVCNHVFLSDLAGLPDSSTESSGEFHECPVCGSTDTEKEA
jgi:hypothetical protein